MYLSRYTVPRIIRVPSVFFSVCPIFVPAQLCLFPARFPALSTLARIFTVRYNQFRDGDVCASLLESVFG